MRRALREHGLGLLVIALVAGAVYVNALGTPFIWDDDWLIQQNTGMQDLRNVPAFFTPGYWQEFYTEHFRSFPGRGYRPVAEISFAIDYAIWGLNPFGFHLTNVLVHIANCVLAYFLTYRIFGHKRIAVFAILLFAAHPLHTEAIVWAKVRSQLLALTFMLASVLAYARYADLGRTRRGMGIYVASVVAFGLAVLCKATTIIAPALIALYVWCFVPRRRWPGALLGLLPFAGLIMWLFSINPFNPDMPRTPYPPMTYLIAIVVVLGEYTRLFVAPVGLCLHRQWHTALAHLYGQLPTTGPFVMAVIGGAVLALRRSREAFFALGWYVIALTPAFRVAFMGRQLAESRMYGPSIGLCMIFGLLLHRLASLSPTASVARLWHRVAVGLCVLVVGVCSGLTVVRNVDWGDSFGLWRDTVEKNPTSWHGQIRVARAYFHRNQFEKALEHMEVAFELRPRDTEALQQLGNLCEQMGQDAQAIRHYRKLLDLDSDNVIARVRLGVIYAKRGDDPRALWYLQRAVEIDPRAADARYNLAVFHVGREEYEKAIAQFEHVVKLRPDSAQMHQDLAAAYAAAGMIDEAGAEYRNTVALDPESSGAWLAIGSYYEHLGDRPQAISSYRRCVALGGPMAQMAQDRLAALGAVPSG